MEEVPTGLHIAQISSRSAGHRYAVKGHVCTSLYNVHQLKRCHRATHCLNFSQVSRTQTSQYLCSVWVCWHPSFNRHQQGLTVQKWFNSAAICVQYMALLALLHRMNVNWGGANRATHSQSCSRNMCIVWLALCPLKIRPPFAFPGLHMCFSSYNKLPLSLLDIQFIVQKKLEWEYPCCSRGYVPTM